MNCSSGERLEHPVGSRWRPLIRAVVTAAIIACLYALSNVLGIRGRVGDFFLFLATGRSERLGSAMLGGAHVLLYFVLVVLAPIDVLGSAIYVALGTACARRTRSRLDERHDQA